MWASRHAAKVALCLAERPADAEELPGYESHLAWLGYLPERGEDRAVRDPRRALMDAVDGNAIGGQLIDVFGTEMTAARGPAAPAGQWPNLSSTGGPPAPWSAAAPAAASSWSSSRRTTSPVSTWPGWPAWAQTRPAFGEQPGFADSPGCQTSTQEPHGRSGHAAPRVHLYGHTGRGIHVHGHGRLTYAVEEPAHAPCCSYRSRRCLQK